MIDTTPPVHPATARIEASLQEHFGPQAGRLERAAEHFETAKAKLYRSGDGQPVYAPEEHQQRLDGLLADYDSVGADVKATAEEAIAAGRQELAKLDGASPLDRLTAEEQQAASTRALFVREDCETLPLSQLTARVRAVLASGDRVDSYLLGRYAGARLNADGQRSPGQSLERTALAEVLQELQGRLADPKAKEKREKAEQRISSAQVLGGKVRMKRLHLDGTVAADAEAMRRRYAF